MSNKPIIGVKFAEHVARRSFDVTAVRRFSPEGKATNQCAPLVDKSVNSQPGATPGDVAAGGVRGHIVV